MIEFIMDIIRTIGLITLGLFIGIGFHVAADVLKEKWGTVGVIAFLLVVLFGMVFYLVRTS